MPHTIAYDSTVEQPRAPDIALRVPPLTATGSRKVRAALYLRVSTRADKRDDDATRQRKRQDIENQRRQLQGYCEAQGWQIVNEYIDEESGAKSERAGFQRMWHDAAQRRFDVLLFWALDRFSREGVLETLNHLQRLNSYGINWRSHTEQYLDSCGVYLEAVLAILAAIAKAGTHSNSASAPALGWIAPARKARAAGDHSVDPALYSTAIGSGNCARKVCPGVRSRSNCTPAPRRYEGRTPPTLAIPGLAGKKARKPAMFETGNTPVRPPLRPPE